MIPLEQPNVDLAICVLIREITFEQRPRVNLLRNWSAQVEFDFREPREFRVSGEIERPGPIPPLDNGATPRLQNRALGHRQFMVPTAM